MDVELGPIEFEISQDDIMAFRKHYFFRSESGRRRLMLRRLVWFLVLLAPGIARLAREYPSADLIRFAGAVFVVVGSSGALAWFIPTWGIKAGPDTQSLAAQGRWQFTARLDGLAHVHIEGSALMPWTDFNRIEHGDSALYVFAGERALLIPLRAFESQAAADRFAAYVQARIDAHTGSV